MKMIEGLGKGLSINVHASSTQAHNIPLLDSDFAQEADLDSKIYQGKE